MADMGSTAPTGADRSTETDNHDAPSEQRLADPIGPTIQCSTTSYRARDASPQGCPQEWAVEQLTPTHVGNTDELTEGALLRTSATGADVRSERYACHRARDAQKCPQEYARQQHVREDDRS